ncbi:MAG: response regulator, partial [Spirochaetia bacterium]
GEYGLYLDGRLVALVCDDQLFVKPTVAGRAYASNADEAITLLEAHPEITIVFTDIQMAGSMDGIALSNWAADRWPPLRFIIVSAGLRPDAVKMPVDAVFLAKPFAIAAVSGAIAGFRASA